MLAIRLREKFKRKFFKISKIINHKKVKLVKLILNIYLRII